MSKKISIIIPCYLAEKYIDRCANSLVHQSIGIENLELIFVNDASPDDTLVKLLSWEQRYPDSIIVINSDINLKQGGARNLGMQYASSDYIGFVDADDWVDLTMYEKLYTKAIKYDCEVVSCDYKRVFEESDVMEPTTNEDSFFIIEDVETRKDLLISGLGTGGICIKLFHRSIIFNNNIFFPEGLAYEDNYFISFIMLYVKKIYYLEEYLYYYYVNTASTTTTSNAMHHFDRLTIEIMKLEEMKRRGFFDLYYEEIEFSFLILYYFNTLHILLTRFNKIPLEVINQMRQNVVHFFPSYKENSYLDAHLVNLYRYLLPTIETALDEAQWAHIASEYALKLSQ